MPKKLAKNRKRAWKKTDITEVEEFLDDQRLQLRTGGLVSEKSDDQLFFIDAPVNSEDKEPEVKLKKEPKKLKCYSNLEPDPKIPVLSKYVRGHTSKRKNQINKPVPQKLKQSIEQRKKSKQLKALQKQLELQPGHQEAYDLWGDDSNDDKLDEHYAVVTKKRRVNTPKTFYVKPSALSAVEAPHPGSSYNPAFDDHQELLHKAISRQVKEDLNEAKIERRLKPDYEAHGGKPTQESQMKEFSEGLGLYDDHSDSADSQEEDNNSNSIMKNRPKLKTKKQRRKQEKAKQQAKDRLKEKKERMLADRNKIDRIKSIQKEIKLQEQKAAERAASKQVKLDSMSYKTQRLHKQRFVEPEADVLLTKELTGSLRLSQCRNTLLEDRYKSLQKRNIVVPRGQRRSLRKRKVKYAEKKQFKEITLSSRAGGGIVIPHTKSKHDE